MDFYIVVDVGCLECGYADNTKWVSSHMTLEEAHKEVQRLNNNKIGTDHEFVSVKIEELPDDMPVWG